MCQVHLDQDQFVSRSLNFIGGSSDFFEIPAKVVVFGFVVVDIFDKGGFSGILLTSLSKSFDCIDQDVYVRYMCDMFFIEIEIIDFANYVDNNTPYTCNFQIEKVTETLEKNAEKLFQWFYNKFLKVNPEKCHFLTNNLEKTAIDIRSDKYYFE